MNRNIFLPGLKDVKINKVEICEHSIHLYVEMPVKPHRCPRCGTEGRKIHDYRIQKIRHFKWFERPTVIFYRKRRYVCQACGKRFAEENPFVERYQRFSKEWNQAVNVRSIHAKTFKDLAFQFGASVSTVIRRFDAVAKKELQGHPELPKVIAIDEYKGDTRAGKYQVIIADGQTGEPQDFAQSEEENHQPLPEKVWGAGGNGHYGYEPFL